MLFVPPFSPIFVFLTSSVAVLSDVTAFVVGPQDMIGPKPALDMWFRVDDEPPIDIDLSKFEPPAALPVDTTVKTTAEEYPRAADFEAVKTAGEEVLPAPPTAAEEEEPIDWSEFRSGPPPPSDAGAVVTEHHSSSQATAAASPERRRIFSRLLPMNANVHDVWWEYGRAWIAQPGGRSPRPPEWEAPAALPLNEESVMQVLREFVESDFAMTMCNYFNVDGTESREIGGMFEYVQLDCLLQEGTIILRLKSVFEEKKKSLLERLSRYLRARIPQVREVHSMHRDGRDIYI